MKNIIRLTTLLLVIVLAGTTVFSVSAAAPGQEPEPQTPAPESISSEVVQTTKDEFVLRDLGFLDAKLLGPFASSSVDFSIPPEWVFSQSGNLQLRYSSTVSYRGGASDLNTNGLLSTGIVGGQLEIRYNDTLISTQILAGNGEQVVNISIPASAYVSPREDGRSSITFSLISNESCYYDLDVVLNISANSILTIPHEIGTPTIDLARLPYPIYQRSPLQPYSAIMVIPDQPSLENLRAMIEVASGFGNMSSGNLALSTVTTSELTPEMMADNHLIFVGQPGAFSQLGQVVLPITFVANGFDSATGVQQDDGLIQMAVSPWNPSLTVLLISGNTDAGVVKAAHVINVGKVLTIDSQNYAIIQDIDPGVRMKVSEFDLRFSDLGMQDRTIRGAMNSSSSTSSTTEIEFFVPNDQQISLDSYVEIHYNHSELIDFSNSGITILLNGRPIGSIGFSEEDVNFSVKKIILPRSVVLPGKNTISLQVSMYPIGICDSLYNQEEAYWTTLYSDSLLHISLENVFIPPARVVDLKLFPGLLMLNPTPGKLAFIIDAMDPAANEAAASIAFQLGDYNNIITNDVIVQKSDQVDMDSLAGKDVLIVGIPKNLPQVTEWKDALPVAFENGTNKLSNLNAEVTYRIPENASVGYLQLFPAPWDNSRVVLSILGSTPEALQNAGRAFSDPIIQPSLVGNFAILSGTQVIALDTRLTTGFSALPEGTPVEVEVSPEEIAQQTGEAASTTSRSGLFAGNLPENNWILPMLIISTSLAVLIVLGVVVSSLVRTRNRKKPIIVEVEEEK